MYQATGLELDGEVRGRLVAAEGDLKGRTFAHVTGDAGRPRQGRHGFRARGARVRRLATIALAPAIAGRGGDGCVRRRVRSDGGGQARIACGRVTNAGSYVFQYKLEPSQPTDPWLATIATKLASTTVGGLAPEQLIRARVQAVGITAGPWSAEVVGRAK